MEILDYSKLPLKVQQQNWTVPISTFYRTDNSHTVPLVYIITIAE